MPSLGNRSLAAKEAELMGIRMRELAVLRPNPTHRTDLV